MKKLILFALFLPFASFAQPQNIFGGKPQYDILVRQFPDTFGTFRIELYPAVAPLHTQNFDTLAKQGFYDSLAFHRVVSNFVIQGGDPNSKTGPPSTWGQGAPWQQTVPAEFSPLNHGRETIGAARSANINSATSQFYVNVANNSNLNGNYTLYGRVIDGMNVVDSVEAVPVDANDRPIDKVDMFMSYVGIDSTMPAQAPALNNPADGATGILSSQAFSWSDPGTGDFILYTIQFSQDSTFSTGVFEKHVLPTSLSYSPGESIQQGFVTYYWRVQANNGGNRLSSEVRSFTTWVEAPTLMAPADGSTDQFRNPTMEWNSVVNADEYNLVISTLPALQTPAFIVLDTTVSSTSFITPVLEENKQYYWGVRSVNSGLPGDFSPIWDFRTGSTITGLEGLNRSEFFIHPNPSTGLIKVQGQGEMNITVLNILGIKLLEERSVYNSVDFDLRKYGEGIYLIRISSNGRDSTHKVLIRE